MSIKNQLKKGNLLKFRTAIRREGYLMVVMLDIDCGCAFKGGRLGCLDTLEEFYV